MDNSNENPTLYELRYQVFAAIFTALNFLHNGVGYGFSSILLPPELLERFSVETINANNLNRMEYGTNSSERYLHVEANDASWIASLVALSSVVGSFFSGQLMDYFGRKRISLLASAINFSGWVTMYCSNDVIPVVYVARFLAGFGEGLSAVGLVYISEISHTSVRTSFLGLVAGSVSVGVAITSIVGYFIAWRGVAVFSAALAFITFIGILPLPETPLWIYYNIKDDLKRDEKMIKSLQWLYRNEEMVKSEMDHICSKTADDVKGTLDNEKPVKIWKPVLIVLILSLIVRCSGPWLTVLFAFQIFKAAGADNYSAWILLILTGVARVGGAIFVAFRCFGRVPLLLSSAVGAALCSYFAAGWIYVYSPSLTPAIFILVQVCFASYGLLALPGAITGELLPHKVRGKFSGHIFACVHLMSFILSRSFIPLEQKVHIENVFIIFGAFATLTMCFVYFFVPETQGKTLDEIQEAL